MLFFVLTYLAAFSEAASVGGDVTPDGLAAQVILPDDQRLHNKAGTDGSGLCVFTSLDHSARVGNVPQLIGFRDYMTKFPGGGYPEKVTKMIERLCKDRNMPVPPYIQVEGLDLDILRKACQSGRMPSITYSVSATGRYNGQWIAHMVNLSHADEKHFGVLDNNYEHQLEWLNEAEFKKTYYGRPFGGQPAKGWCVILLSPGFPPDFKN